MKGKLQIRFIKIYDWLVDEILLIETITGILFLLIGFFRLRELSVIVVGLCFILMAMCVKLYEIES